MTFNESNTVEAFIRDRLCGDITRHTTVGPGLARSNKQISGLGWHYLSHQDLPRQPQEAIVERHLSEALIRLNPDIAADSGRADEVLYRLRAIIMSVRSDGLVKANEEFAAWLTGEKSMPFGENGEHVTVNLIDFEDLERNQYVVTQQYIFRAGEQERRADLILLVNGIPLVLIEAKTPVRSSQSWFDGALQVNDYERNIPELFVPNVLSIATEGKELYYGSIRMPADNWGPWRLEGNGIPPSMRKVEKAVASMLRPKVVLDLLKHFTSYATHKGKQRTKIIARYQQYDGSNKLVERVVAKHPKKGLIWHFQGSGKSLLMLFAARRLRLHPALENPTVMIVVDRIDLDSQISSTFYAADAPNLVKAESRKELKDLLEKGIRKIIITTIHKFGEIEGVLDERDNIIVLVDEAHRTQEGELGRKMRDALPNAFLFGLTGTPISRFDRNTFSAFGAADDANRYMSRYSFKDSLRDGATKELHLESRLVDLHVNQEQIEEEFKELTEHLDDEERDRLSKKAAKIAVLLKSPERVEKVCADIASHFQEKVAPNNFGAQVVAYDREGCVLYKKALDRHLPPETSHIFMTVNSGEERYASYRLERDAEERLLDRFRDPNDPLKIIIVTSKLLTGFDAPILQTMYLDRPLRDHTLLQAICRTNRPYGRQKTHGLIVDYVGVFDNVAQAIRFDEEEIRQVVSNISTLKKSLPGAMQKCLEYFLGVDRSLAGYEGLMAAQECLPNNDVRDRFAADMSDLAKRWEAISPDPILGEYETDYRWLASVYESVKPVTATGQLLWHRLGEKTIELIHKNVKVDAVHDDLDTLIVNSDLLEAVIGTPDPEKKSKEIEIKVAKRLQRHLDDPRFKSLAERLEDLRNKHERGLLVSVDFLKELLTLAKDVVETEKTTPSINEQERDKAALTELFENVRNDNTPIIAERIVSDIDEIVQNVRFEEWQNSHAGTRQIKQALRKTLLKYRLHKNQDLFDKAYDYIKKYY